MAESGTVRAFWVKKLRYIWNPDSKRFLRLIGMDKGVKNQDFHSYAGHGKDEQEIR